MDQESFESASRRFGIAAKRKLSNVAASGEPEDQLRTPIERLIDDLANLVGLPKGAVALVGESSLSHLQTRPDYAVTVQQSLCGFIEIKQPGKGADPRNFTGHDKTQWEKLQSLPNLVYTDGNAWSLWRSGALQGEIAISHGDVRTSGQAIVLPQQLLSIISDFLRWQPTPPADAQQLATVTARLCKLLRAEVTEELAAKNPALTDLANDWRKLLFPEASDAAFADGYAQAVTFGLLMARAQGVKLSNGIGRVASDLRQTNSLIGTALRLLTDEAESSNTLTTSLRTLVRVLDVVSWKKISKGDADAWLYFYEGFLAEYDNELRKKTGSYYTPPEVVTAMVRLVHEALVTRFQQPQGLASRRVTFADPAVGTGTFPLGILRQIADIIREDEGDGAVAAAIEQAISRLIAFEMQLGPFAVAQLRLMGELQSLIGKVPRVPLRMYVTDTLSNPYVEMEELGTLTKAIAESRRMANDIKKNERITVVIGNPPYKEKAMRRGGWVESGGSGRDAPLDAWIPPKEWKVSAHAKHLRNLYIYFWRWATWKVFDQHRSEGAGIVCFITVAGFLNGPGFQRMRDYLRRTATELWVIDCTPEGHQPAVGSRIFQGVQQPVCIVLAARSIEKKDDEPAKVHYRQLPAGRRQEKFAALADTRLDDNTWQPCASEWRAPFLPEATDAWTSFTPLEDVFLQNCSGVMPGRTWVIAPDSRSLVERWNRLIAAGPAEKEALFHPHMRGGSLGDKHSKRVVKQGLGNRPHSPKSVADEQGPCIEPTRYGYRSFDRQWIIPDARLINQPNPGLWGSHSDAQIYMTAFTRTSPRSGPAATFTALVPDLHHYKGSFGGRVFGYWADSKASQTNVSPALVALLGQRLGQFISADDVLSYVASVLCHPAYTARFQTDLKQPGLRIPFSLNPELFAEAAALGREVIWLHTFGERFADAKAGRPASSPRMPKGVSPRVPADEPILSDPESFPDEISYDSSRRALHIGSGRIDRVTPEMWAYDVDGKQVLTQWFSYRRLNRERPIMGDRREPSRLGEIQPATWPAEYTSELLNVLHVLGRLIELEPTQASLLERICDGPLILTGDLDRVRTENETERAERRATPPELFEHLRGDA